MKKFILLNIFLVLSLFTFAQNVGIGTTSPNAKLEIVHNGTNSDPQLLLYEDANDYARIGLNNRNSSNFWTIGGYIASSNARHDILTFRNEANGDLMVLKGNGKLGLAVGISPKTPLHVGEDKRVLFGKDTLGSGAKLMFLPKTGAFRVGSLDNSRSTYWNRDSIGVYSFASGRNTRAKGLGSTAMGAETEATNPYAFASGYYSNADGNFSTAMGFNTDASGLSSTALGTNTAAEQAHTFAVGHTAEAQAIYAIAMGNRTIAQSYNSMAIGSYNIGGGSPNEWLNSDPIFEIGIGQSTNSRHNALTVLKNGRHGILTNSPKASLHVKDDGVIGSGTIVAVLESKVSDRPILQFSETANGDKDSGMSIEYDGSGTGSNNKMYINDTDGLPTVTFESGGQVGIGIINPTFALHLPNNTSKGLARAFSWSTYSDKRIKSNEKPLSYGLNEIMMLKPLSYRQHGASIKASKLEVDTNSTKSIGFFAQEVYQIIPEAVVKPKDPNEQLWGMEYEKLIPVLVKAIQEQQLEILKLKEEVKKLSN